MTSIQIKPISSSQTLGVRHPVLRPNRILETAIFEGDDDVDTIHLGAFDGPQLTGVVSLMRKPMSEQPYSIGYQLRGMAIIESFRSQGIGHQLMEGSIQAVKEVGADLIWCNAREHVIDFYKKNGFVSEGQLFDIPDVGPHQKMFLTL